MKRFLIMLAASISFVALLTAPASSQFGDLMKKKGSGGGGGGASQADVELQQEKLVKSYVVAELKMVEAQILMARALKNDELVESLETVAKSLASGNVDKKTLKKASSTTADARKANSKTMAEGAEISAEGKKQFAQSLVPYAQSVASTAAMVIEAKSLAEGITAQVKAAGFSGAMKIKKTFDLGLWLAPKVPVLAGKQGKQLGAMFKFAKKNDIGIPKDALNATKAIPDFPG